MTRNDPAYLRSWRRAHPDKAAEHAATNRAHKRDKAKADPALAAAWRRKEIRRRKALNHQSLADADRRFRKYSPEEDTVVSNLTLTPRQVAKLLGRTVEGVARRRQWLRRQGRIA